MYYTLAYDDANTNLEYLGLYITISQYYKVSYISKMGHQNKLTTKNLSGEPKITLDFCAIP